MSSSSRSQQVERAATLYHELLAAWNARDAEAFAALFARDGSVVGFDGSQVDGAAHIASHLSGIFADHATASYVGIVREVRPLADDVVLLRAVVGMVPPGGTDINPAMNAVQSVVAVGTADDQHIALFQNTPAAWHGRPEAVQALADELRAAWRNVADAARR
jgi:uncharacterized protein (TIGR02246 family)